MKQKGLEGNSVEFLNAILVVQNSVFFNLVTATLKQLYQALIKEVLRKPFGKGTTKIVVSVSRFLTFKTRGCERSLQEINVNVIPEPV